MRLVRLVGLMVVGGLYWLAVCRMAGTGEPWDADGYWRFWYPVSIALSAVAGYVSTDDRWAAGAILTFAQLPVMWLGNAPGPLFVVGLSVLAILAVPAVAASSLAGRFAMRVRPA